MSSQDVLERAESSSQEVPTGEVVSPSVSQARIVRRIVDVIVVCIPVLALAISLVQLKGGWDDGAITAAFARTHAKTGHFALTPVSQEVEGFSSVSWTLLLSVPAYFSSNPDTILVWMKVLAAGAFLYSLCLFRRIARRFLANEDSVHSCTLLLAFLAPPLLETLNGMEMNLFMLLVLSLVELLASATATRPRELSIWVIVLALMLTRFEAPFLLAFICGGLWLWADRARAFRLAIATLASFVVVEFWRYIHFGVWMPNTVYAKMHYPYSPSPGWVQLLRARLFATADVFSVLHGLFLAALCSALVGWLARRFELGVRSMYLVFGCGFVLGDWVLWPEVTTRLLWPGRELISSVVMAVLVIVFFGWMVLRTRGNLLPVTVAALALASFAFGITFGRNWGYNGRMVVAELPFLILSLIFFVERQIHSAEWRQVTLVACLVAQCIGWAFITREAWVAGDPMVTVATVERSGLAADYVRRATSRETLSILLPDVGGSTLCCERLIIHDSALLANPVLARPGYALFDTYLHATHPDVIETHGGWSSHTQIYTSELMGDYSVAVIDGVRLLLRSDVYDQMRALKGARLETGTKCLGDTEASTQDTSFVRSKGNCVYISTEAVTGFRTGTGARQ
jgi:hypothetical protein